MDSIDLILSNSLRWNQYFDLLCDGGGSVVVGCWCTEAARYYNRIVYNWILCCVQLVFFFCHSCFLCGARYLFCTPDWVFASTHIKSARDRISEYILHTKPNTTTTTTTKMSHPNKRSQKSCLKYETQHGPLVTIFKQRTHTHNSMHSTATISDIFLIIIIRFKYNNNSQMSNRNLYL